MTPNVGTAAKPEKTIPKDKAGGVPKRGAGKHKLTRRWSMFLPPSVGSLTQAMNQGLESRCLYQSPARMGKSKHECLSVALGFFWLRYRMPAMVRLDASGIFGCLELGQ